MGNDFPSPLLSPLFSSSFSEQIPWFQDFHLLDKQPLNSTYILHYLPTGTSFKVKYLVLNKMQNMEMFRQIEMRSTSRSPFVVQLEKVQQYTVKGYCSEHEEVFLMFKFVENTLKEEVLNRRFKKERFSEQEIKILIQSGVKGLSYLHSIGCPPKSLNTSQLLITPQRSILVNDPLLSIGSALSNNLFLHNSSLKQPPHNTIFSIPPQDYPSPQKLLHQNDLIDEYNEWLSALFTFGVIVLEAVFLEPMGDLLYDKGQKKIFYHRVKEKVDEISERAQMEKSLGDAERLGLGDDLAGEGMVRRSLVDEIKEDLRRLLSHEPRIRESVYLKYKKINGNRLFLNKASNNLHFQPSPLNISNLQPQHQHHNQNSNNLNHSLTPHLDIQLELLFKKYSQININQHNLNRKSLTFDENKQQLKKNNPQNKFRVVCSSMPSKQPLSSKTSFVMPVTSEYLIGNVEKGEKKAWHRLGKRGTQQEHKEGSTDEFNYRTQFGVDKYKCQDRVKEKLFMSNRYTHDSTWPLQVTDNHSTLPQQFTSYTKNIQFTSQTKNTWSNTQTPLPAAILTQQPSHFPTSTISTTPSGNYSTTNIIRSSTSHVIKPSEFGVMAATTGREIDYDNYLIKERKGEVVRKSFINEQNKEVQLLGSKFVPYSHNFRQYLTSATDNSSQSNKELPTRSSTFVNFQQWKKLQSLSSPSLITPFNTPLNYPQLTSVPSPKHLTHFPFKQVGSINYDDSHFLTDKESFVIESYGTGMHQNKPLVSRVQTPISTIQSTTANNNVYNVSPKNSLEINHSNISSLRNEGKSFSSVEEELKEFRKFGLAKELGEKSHNYYSNKPYSSYSSSEKVSVIDKIFDPEVMASTNDRKSFQSTSNPYQHHPQPHYNTHISQSPSHLPLQKSHRNSSQPYLQTPQRYPAKYKLNSTIREASCQESGVNHSGENNDEWEGVYPMTEVIKGRTGDQEGRRSEGIMGARSQGQNQHYGSTLIDKNKLVQQHNRLPLNQKPLPQPPTSRVILYADSSRYIGQTDHNNESHGHGTLYYSDGQVAYQGQWFHGDFNGFGKLCNPYCMSIDMSFDYKDLTGIDEHLKEYEGEFVKDLKHGKGVFRLRNGEVFEGKFWQDGVNGRGKYYCRDGKVVEGEWDKGKLISVVGSGDAGQSD